MSKLHGNLQDAVASIVDRQKFKAEAKDATPANLFSLKRELRSAAVEGFGRFYYYYPQSPMEKNAHHKHLRLEQGGLTVSLEGIVDGVIARVRRSDGSPMYTTQDRQRILLESDVDLLMAIWSAMGSDEIAPITQADVEKK